MPTSVLAVAAKAMTPKHSSARRIISRAPEVRRNVGPAQRLLSVGLGGGLAVASVIGPKVRPLALVSGVFLLYRGLSGSCPLTQAARSVAHRGRPMPTVIPAKSGVRVELATTINKPVDEVYRACATWADCRNSCRIWRMFGKSRAIDRTGSHAVLSVCGSNGMPRSSRTSPIRPLPGGHCQTPTSIRPVQFTLGRPRPAAGLKSA